MFFQVNGQVVYAYTGNKALNLQQPTVVFIHGAQNDHSVWALQSRYFAYHGYNVLAVDLPGHGRSGGMALNTVGQMANWLLALLDAAKITNASLIGHSMGSLIALETAHQAPARIDKLALLGTAYPMKVSDALLDAAQNEEYNAIDMVNIWSHVNQLHQPSSLAPGFSVLGVSRRLMQRISQINPAKVFHTDFLACNTYNNGETAAHSVACPTLFLIARKDMMTPPKAAQTLINSVTDKQVEILENCGHSMMTEQAELVLNKLYRFIRG
ncbi:alpha/beta fold hydrolase [Undibacterium griseum]|uniref:Alpha/beta hydrolase n=1 Tax=Undibacterium griseum TaxID=2762295 RepID=A0ABR6YM53_9BURK|nr:alpha/beta hydrolase [Undibacterium griseum]MBC3884975.1 alpha/beta hydrolase [Undibacterium griseum]